jgi:hypothetical protein
MAGKRNDMAGRVENIVVDLSRADASALCARLKNDGGSCFVAK